MEEDDIGFARGFIRIPSRDFFGQSSKSPDGRYTLAWRDGGPDQSRHGRWILLDARKIVAEGAMSRPNDGKVANNGVFIINDWGLIENLSRTLAAFTSQGTPLLRRTFNANLFNNGLSADGHWAVCQTVNAPHEDGNKLFVFDLCSKIEIGAFQPASGWASSYTFVPDEQRIVLGYQNGRRFSYTMDGRFLDRSAWLASGLQQGDLLIIERILSEAAGPPSADLIALLLPAIDIALAAERYRDQRSQARAYRFRGTCLDARGDFRDAAAAYEQAVALDPKVGVKHRLDQIRKMLAR
ncbi:tetratricopeptide repeat protein [Bradyrhizobium sp. SZCCHNPS2010]|uniref:tetratricopeptide repeat protein n=1 Tax=Bradyrhizobium sp. SZCCHNPS2010 TaxID=3057333 RepID=UPI002916CFB4|nr:tetratricopeptide repeat protein [Bradyrhizobium sp. SZCCHNPS2010]